MNYRNQSANYGNQNINNMQRGMMPQQTVPYAVMGSTSAPAKSVDACKAVIVSDKCNCLEDMPLAMAYVPWQKFQNLYNEAEAFKRGTIFKDLDLRFCRKGCK